MHQCYAGGVSDLVEYLRQPELKIKRGDLQVRVVGGEVYGDLYGGMNGIGFSLENKHVPVVFRYADVSVGIHYHVLKGAVDVVNISQV